MIDLTRATALIEQLRPHWEKIPAAEFAVAEGPREGLRVDSARNAAGRTQMYLYDAIGGWGGVSARDVVEALAGVDGDLDLHVNSPGGIIYEGAAVYNAYARYQRDGRGKVYAVVDGMAASAASFIVQAGASVEIEANATMMVHDGHGLGYGPAAVMREAADLLDMLSNTIAEMYAKRAVGKTAAEWRAVMVAGDTWYNARQAVAEGLADRVAGDDPDNSNVLGIFEPTASSTPAASDDDAFLAALKGAFL